MLLTPYIEFFSGQVLIYFLLHATLDATNLSKARLKVIVIGSTRATSQISLLDQALSLTRSDGFTHHSPPNQD